MKYIFDFQNIREIIICIAMFVSFVSQKAFFVYFPLVGQLINGGSKAVTGLLYKRKAMSNLSVDLDLWPSLTESGAMFLPPRI